MIMAKKMQENMQYTPCATYFHDSDCVEYVKADTFAVYDRIDEFLTLIWDHTGQELIGFKLKGFKNLFMKRLRPHVKINNEQFLRIVSAIEQICLELGEALTADDDRKKSYQAAADMAANDNVKLSSNYLDRIAA